MMQIPDRSPILTEAVIQAAYALCDAVDELTEGVVMSDISGLIAELSEACDRLASDEHARGETRGLDSHLEASYEERTDVDDNPNW